MVVLVMEVSVLEIEGMRDEKEMMKEVKWENEDKLKR